ncbi:xanthine dehydrogenase iron-sulfur-binding subunit [Escherichia coli]|uniref:Xanthine dehydrogenase iron-sulfur-binding subunit n=1 Tax=Escherichia coli TaxID=562 RepID=A0A377C3V6_ECOLX|nr:xanthine dehydrogenase iron-sulfur-binding subunit [Escherichia coli]
MNHSETITIECTINGMPFSASRRTRHAALGITPRTRTAKCQTRVLRGECGACTVLVDGTAIDSCLYLAAWAEGKEIRTLEGEAKGGKLSHVQQAYAKSGAVQCGFCTPGLIMATTAMLAKPRREAINHYGNSSRTGGKSLSLHGVSDDCKYSSGLRENEVKGYPA